MSADSTLITESLSLKLIPIPFLTTVLICVLPSIYTHVHTLYSIILVSVVFNVLYKQKVNINAFCMYSLRT